MNRAEPLRNKTTQRTPGSTMARRFPHCVGDAYCSMTFSLVRRLPSALSACACALLFERFIGTMPRSDSSPAFMSVFGFRLHAPACYCSQAPARSLGSRACCFFACVGSSTTQDSIDTRATVSMNIAFPFWQQGRHPDWLFRSSIAQPTNASVYASAPTSR
jgi:hypothetical protein